jgi:serine/threonine-protein kinase ATR
VSLRGPDRALLTRSLESPHYHLGRYYDERAALREADRAALNQLTCLNYKLALEKGNKYIYRTMPRMLTIWLDLTESKDSKEEQKK